MELTNLRNSKGEILREKFIIHGRVAFSLVHAIRVHQWPVSPKIGNSPAAIILCPKNLRWHSKTHVKKNIADRKIIAVGDLFLEKNGKNIITMYFRLLVSACMA